MNYSFIVRMVYLFINSSESTDLVLSVSITVSEKDMNHFKLYFHCYKFTLKRSLKLPADHHACIVGLKAILKQFNETYNTHLSKNC